MLTILNRGWITRNFEIAQSQTATGSRRMAILADRTISSRRFEIRKHKGGHDIWMTVNRNNN